MKIAFIIPSRNNLKYLQCAYNSIRKYVSYQHEIVLLDDASTDNTWNWLTELKSKDPNVIIYRNNGPERVGHTVLYDKGVELSTTEVFSIFHADMIVTPNYVENLIKNLKENTVVCATRIEPPLHPGGPEKIVMNFGIEPEEFQYNDYIKFVTEQESVNKDKTTNGIFAPWLMYKKDFLKISGHDKRVFAPMELEDSDLFNRFLLNGYNLVQSRDAFVYHMTCRGSRFKDGVKIEAQIPLNDGSVWHKPQDSDEYKSLRIIKFREWWRKWHMNVLHDELMMPKVCKRYDVGYVIHNSNPQIINFIEPWSDTIYVDTSNSTISNYIKEEQKISHFNIEKRIKSINDEKTNNIIIEFDARKFNQEHCKFIADLMSIIEDSGEIGQFEYDIFNITINSIESYEHKLIDADDSWYLNKLK
jgi:glycosyltransferase involved in cell wall biosynthesis